MTISRFCRVGRIVCVCGGGGGLLSLSVWQGSLCLSSCVEMRRFCLPVSEGCGVCRVGHVLRFILS